MSTGFHFLNPVTEGVTLTIGQLNLVIARLLEQGLTLVRVQGEISNFSCAVSGHWYFSLKDEHAQIRCVMFRGRNQDVDFQPRDGQAIEAKGVVSLYAIKGELQLNVETLKVRGAGDLFIAFQRLKEKLATQGFFDVKRKRLIPIYPKSIGVITSLQAAALADVLTVFARRASHIPIYIYPAPVQGIDAAYQLAAIIEIANQRAEVEVLLLCRGGGSIEDLWAFNEEVLARAVLQSKLPVVVGVGHETDFTIADFVADLRAPTPSAAAELMSKHRDDLLCNINVLQQRLSRCLQRYFEAQTQRLDNLVRRLPYPRMRFDILSESLNRIYVRLQHVYIRLLTQQRNRWQLAKMGLEYLDPQRTLDRGYAVLFDHQGEVVRSLEQLTIGVPMQLYIAQGCVQLQLSQVVRDESLDLLHGRSK